MQAIIPQEAAAPASKEAGGMQRAEEPSGSTRHAFAGLVLEPLPVGAWAFLAATTAVATKTLNFAQAFAAFTDDAIWLIVVAFFFARVGIRYHPPQPSPRAAPLVLGTSPLNGHEPASQPGLQAGFLTPSISHPPIAGPAWALCSSSCPDEPGTRAFASMLYSAATAQALAVRWFAMQSSPLTTLARCCSTLLQYTVAGLREDGPGGAGGQHVCQALRQEHSGPGLRALHCRGPDRPCHAVHDRKGWGHLHAHHQLTLQERRQQT